MVRCILAIVAVFIAWSALDFLIHGVMLSPTYEATAELWRPPNKMKRGLMMIVTGIAAIAFTSIYCCLVDRKNIKMGLLFGLLFGIARGSGWDTARTASCRFRTSWPCHGFWRPWWKRWRPACWSA